MRYALINDRTSIVENVIEAAQESDFRPPAGYTLIQSDRAASGWIYENGEFTNPYLPPPPTLDEVKNAKMSEINGIYEQHAAMVKVDTPADEVQTWAIQQKEWEAWTANPQASTPFVDGLAAARQIDKALLMEKIGEKVVAFQAYMGNLTGKRQYCEDRIKAATTTEEAEAVIWN